MTSDLAGTDWGWMLEHVGVYALVLARVLGLCLTAPTMGVPGLDWRFRVGIAAMIGVLLTPLVETLVATPSDWAGIAWAAVAEAMTGGVLGWSAAMIVAGARM